MTCRVRANPHAQPDPDVWVCAWHPKHFGCALVRVPPSVPVAEVDAYVRRAEQEGRVTHGICAGCQVLVRRELRALIKEP